MPAFTLQPMISDPFLDINGNSWPNTFIATYNRFTQLINRSAGKEIARESLTYNEREFYLDQRHKNYVQFSTICQQQLKRCTK